MGKHFEKISFEKLFDFEIAVGEPFWFFGSIYTHQQERTNLQQEIYNLKQKLEESNGFADEITLKLEEESLKCRVLEVKLGESQLDSDVLKESIEFEHKTRYMVQGPLSY